MDHDKYLLKRGGVYWYKRRIPDAAGGGWDRRSLKTGDLLMARRKRDEIDKQNSAKWSAIMAGASPGEMARYDAAIQRAQRLELAYVDAHDLARANHTAVEELLRRVAIAEHGSATTQDAALGLVDIPQTTISEALTVYLSDIATAELQDKSPGQKKNWTQHKLRAVKLFIEQVGDKPISTITRDDARKVHRHLSRRIETEGMSTSNAKRPMGDLRKVFAEYMAHIGQPDHANPFDKLSFKVRRSEKKAKRLPFPTDHITSKLLAPEAMQGLNRDARLILLALVETGCRLSEVANILPENIVLDHPVPHLRIRHREGREVKTVSAERDVPLVGVSLAAMKLAPNGFPRYHDREASLSNTLMKHLRRKRLLPSSKYTVHSLRHSWEDRLKNVQADYETRIDLMGHSNIRPKYGVGPTLETKLDALKQLVLPFDREVLQ